MSTKKFLRRASRYAFLRSQRVWAYLTLLYLRILYRTDLLLLYQPLPDVKLGMGEMRPRITERLERIRESLPEGRTLSGADIGCNMGFYCFELAKDGHFMSGFELQEYIVDISRAAQKHRKVPNVCFSTVLLSPENIESFPRYDFVILMSVFHHWCNAFGSEAAMKLLGDLVERTQEVIFFETAQTNETSEKYQKVLPDMGEDPEKWLHAFFLKSGCTRVETILHGGDGRHLLAAYKN